jgi:hypothetical protein
MATAGKKWTENYSKFNTLDSDDSDDEIKSSVKIGVKNSNLDETKTSLDGSPILHPTDNYDFDEDVDYSTHKARIKSLPQNVHEVWQITCCKLKCWTALKSPNHAAAAAAATTTTAAADDDDDVDDDDESLVARPWAVLVACIYPEEGRLIGYDVDPIQPHLYPVAQSVVRCLLRLMRDPPFGSQRRPVPTISHTRNKTSLNSTHTILNKYVSCLTPPFFSLSLSSVIPPPLFPFF